MPNISIFAHIPTAHSRRLNLLYLSLVLLSSCVGKVESNQRPEVKSPIETSDHMGYDGVLDARAISHDAIEVQFAALPASVQDGIFKIHLNNATIPINVVAQDISPRADGRYMYTLYNLKPGTIYSVKVYIFDKIRKKLIKSKNQLTVRTFPQRVASFKGIRAIESFLGSDSMSKLRLIYEPAENDSKINVKDYHNKRYIIRYTWGDNAERDILDFENATNKAIMYQDHYSGSRQNSSYDAFGLIPGTNYCFNITTEHREHYYKEAEEVVPLESNSKYECASTAESVGLMEWDASSVKFSLGLGPGARDTIQASWDSASGAFAGYMLLIAGVEIGTSQKIDERTANQFTDLQMDSLIPNDPTHVKQIKNNSGAWDPNLRNFSISGLDSYAYYQVRLVVCRNAECKDADRIESPMQVLQTVPDLPTNGGVDTILDPWDKTDPNRGKVEFTALDINSGYADFLHLYCFRDETGADPIKVDYSIPVDQADHPCHGVTRQTNHPASYKDFATFTEIEFTDDQGVNGNRYCFGVIPQIVDMDYSTDNSSYPVKVVCKTLRLLTPTLEQFPGVTSTCDSSKVNQDSLTIDWENPTGGLYTKYETYLVKKTEQNFSFAKATSGDADYTVVDNLADGTNTYQFTNLVPGEIYQVGVLTYLDDGNGGKIYSESNNGIIECQIPFPEASFTMFQDIMAVGPKTHGLHPEHYLTALNSGDDRKRRKHLLETIDPITHLPVEVELNSDETNPATSSSAAHAHIVGTKQFDGIYGRKDNEADNPIHAYSNQGMVRLVWEDFRLSLPSKRNGANCESLRVDGKMNLYEAGCVYGDKTTEEMDKNNRKFGYKIYRSYNNKSSWQELTISDGSTPQSPLNAGLIRAKDYYYWGWNGLEGSSMAQERKQIYAASFIDYSVLYQPADFSTNNPVERGLIAYYKIVPVFNGKEINFDDQKNKNVVRVIIPPANMAFVHRKMANKAMCDQLASEINTDPEYHYSCEYNGLGARPVVDFSKGRGRYDIGSDLLVDRYEIGCQFTRGSTSEAQSTIHDDFASKRTDLRAHEFEGTSQSGNFIGCHAEDPHKSQRGDTSLAWDTNGTGSYDYLLKGDCIGQGVMQDVHPSFCPSGELNTYGPARYKAPGLSKNMDCGSSTQGPDNPHTLADNVIEYFLQPAQPHAVYYFRDSQNTGSLPSVPGPNGTRIDAGDPWGRNHCLINLPYKHDFGEGNRYVPRWFSLDKLLTDHAEKSLRDIYDDRTSFYDNGVGSSDVLSPTEGASNIISDDPNYSHYLDRNIVRYMTSNESQLPPLNFLSQYTADKVCKNYEVELGSKNNGGDFIVATNSRQQKQLPSKKLMLAFSQWPQTFRPPFNQQDENLMGHMERIVDGTRLQGQMYEGEVEHAENLSCNVAGKSRSSVGFNSGSKIGASLANSHGDEVLTGSTQQRSEPGNSTEGCMSRFGVQDFVGNVQEVEAGRYDCDTSEEELLYGPTEGHSRYNSSILFTGNSTGFYSTLPIHSDYSAWVQSGNQTGQCSPYTTGTDDKRKTSIAGAINPAVLFDGTLNTNLVDTAYPILVNESLDDMRDGFGNFWETGQNTLSPAITKNGTFALELTNNKYFNPAIGVPLNAAFIDNPSSLYTDPQTNPKIGTQRYFENPDNSGTIADEYKIPYFPIGQSQMSSTGMSATGTENRTYTQGVANQEDTTFLYSVEKDSPAMPTKNTGKTLQPSTWGGGDVTMTSTHWALPRNHPTTFYNGGNHETTTPGRYTASFTTAISKSSGVRCLVRIPSH